SFSPGGTSLARSFGGTFKRIFSPVTTHSTCFHSSNWSRGIGLPSASAETSIQVPWTSSISPFLSPARVTKGVTSSSAAPSTNSRLHMVGLPLSCECSLLHAEVLAGDHAEHLFHRGLALGDLEQRGLAELDGAVL